ncbi:MAG TPA: sulfite exporter TauE/SafE family protein [Dongiaceae bacterium]|nr:sulfite exporter TauE/SafE family protein [Dongiaceae bacterium]
MDFLTGAFFAVAALSLVAGAVRGFVGFGAGMIMIPVISAMYGPKIGASSILIADGVLTIPYLLKSIRHCEPRTVFPVALAAVIAIPIGTYLLGIVDPIPLRWSLVPIIAALLLLTLSGWRYRNAPSIGMSLAAGATSGLLSGLIQLSGPPVVALWISGPSAPATIRANIFVYFGVTTVVAVVSYVIGGIFGAGLIQVLMPMIPCYAVGLAFGGRMFGKVNPKVYRWVAVGLIGLAVISSLPILDRYLR